MTGGVEKQVTVEAFYEMAQLRNGASDPQLLVGHWEADRMALVEQRVGEALESCGIIGTVAVSFATDANGYDRSNQSKGNVAGDALATALASDENLLAIEKLSGAGYPDRRMVFPDDGFSCCFELKATSDWNERDSNRRVLTSSPTKLISAINDKKLPERPCHLIGTVIYDRESGIIEGVRLDFIEPNSPVNVRLEASTSHQLLSQGKHRSSFFS